MHDEEEVKQVIVIRSDIAMSKGKAAAQAAHASVEAVLQIIDSHNIDWKKWLREWRQQGQKKVVVRADSEKELVEVYEKARTLRLPASLIIDAGKTELAPGTRTAVAVGPAPSNLIDKVTGKLRLY